MLLIELIPELEQMAVRLRQLRADGRNSRQPWEPGVEAALKSAERALREALMDLEMEVRE